MRASRLGDALGQARVAVAVPRAVPKESMMCCRPSKIARVAKATFISGEMSGQPPSGICVRGGAARSVVLDVSFTLMLGERSRLGVGGVGEGALRWALSAAASAGTPMTGFASGGVAGVAFADESASVRVGR
eukprot:6175677-Pleurochrysis_carterae.AAC.2